MGPNLLCSMTTRRRLRRGKCPWLAVGVHGPASGGCLPPYPPAASNPPFEAQTRVGPDPVDQHQVLVSGSPSSGIPELTLVRFVPKINVRADFDRHTDEFGPGGLSALARPYAVFAWLLVKADILFSFLDGGFLLELRWRR